MKNKYLMVIIIFISIGSTVFSQTDERRRGLYIDAGIGMVINDLGELGNGDILDRIGMSIDANIGWAILQNFYIVGSLPGFSNRLYKSSDFYNMDTCLFGLGVRYYPLPSLKYLQIGTDMRFGRIVLYSNNIEIGTYSIDPFGMKFSAAYDFATTMTGSSLLIGGEYFFDYFIENKKTITGFSIIVKYVFK